MHKCALVYECMRTLIHKRTLMHTRIHTYTKAHKQIHTLAPTHMMILIASEYELEAHARPGRKHTQIGAHRRWRREEEEEEEEEEEGLFKGGGGKFIQG